MMHSHLRSISLCGFLFARAAFAQDPAPPAATPAPYTKPAPASSGAKGPSGYGAARPHYEDKFAGMKPDPKHPIDYEYPDQHSINDFLAEPRDIFRLMDQVVTDVIVGADGKPLLDAEGKRLSPDLKELPAGATKIRRLEPLDFGVKPGSYDTAQPGQRAAMGRNTWLLWCGGNEDFWDWLAQDGYGVLDFLKGMDSRKRGSRFATMGLFNQPGLKSTSKPGPWGLYLDQVERKIGVEGDDAPPYSTNYPAYVDPQGRKLESDGVDPKVYGYPSGVIGLRLFPNPNFDEAAQRRWNAEAFYNDHAYATDPKTVRPFWVGMSCAICHVSAHPLNPPANAEEPKWENLSSIIGAQYWRTGGAFGPVVERTNFLWHFLAAQQPGCIDTSMTASDQISNANAMNAVFELPARVARARLNPPEIQGAPGRTFPGDGDANRLVARVLADGADSVGVFGALARVYLNIGLYHDEWNKCSNTVIGFVPQKPFSINACRSNSLYWRVNENFRVNYLAEFFLWDKRNTDKTRYQCSTQGMRLKDALAPSIDGQPSGKKFIETPEGKAHWNEVKAQEGSKVFTEHCMVCHSSKQPAGYKIDFAHEPPKPATKWQDLNVSDSLVMPFSWANWEDFKKSPAYAAYVAKARDLAGNGDPAKMSAFLDENYLATDLRIPVSLTETNSARAMGTNGVEGQVWAEYASETYKQLPPVARISYFNPISKKQETYQPPGKGPGYYRVQSLVSVWATAPLLHTNGLGYYIPDYEENKRVSVAGRLEMFDDAIRKMLWKDKRGQTPSGERGLRDPSDTIWRGADPGWIFRTDVETEFEIPRGHLKHLVEGILPGFVPEALCGTVLCLLYHPWIIPLLLTLLSVVLLLWAPRWFFYLMILTGLILLVLLALTGVHYVLPWVIWLLPLAVLVGGILWVTLQPCDTEAVKADASTKQTEAEIREAKKKKWLAIGALVGRWAGVAAYGLVLVGLLATLWVGREFVLGRLGDLRVGPFPKGMPVSTLMNVNPAAPLTDLLAVGRGMASTIGKLRADDSRPANKRRTPEQRLAIFEKEAGPALMKVSKCPDFILDRGHYFGESLTDAQKEALIAFLKTL